jgi:ectoine hydroxylase-related dioxygenase (phytanoyl-CoA dioxygenase family)
MDGALQILWRDRLHCPGRREPAFEETKMASGLSREQVEFFNENGYLTPLRVMSENRARAILDEVEAFERETAMAADSLELKVHLYFDWFLKLVRGAAVTAIAKDLLGPDILLWATRFWIKRARDRKYVGWHQDMAYFQLDPQEMITLWMALSPATVANGAMRFAPGSHRHLEEHLATYDKDSLLSRGQYVPGVDEAAAIDAVLRPGELSIHHGNLLHSSPPNETDGPRVGIAMMMFPAHVRSTGPRRTATLVCGEDRYHHWDRDPEPACDRDPAILELMNAAIARYRDPAIEQAARQPGE